MNMNDPEQIEAWFEQHDDEHCEFERIPAGERLHESHSLCGLLKLYSLFKEPAKFGYCAEHDQLYIADLDDLVDLTEDDVIYLRRCGLFYDSDAECISEFT
jgi:hypothetical protein